MRKILGISILIFSLNACLGPHYVPPCVDIPNNWRVPADESSTLCNMRWWEQFQDPVLNRLIQIALENNQDLQVAISRVFQYYDNLVVVGSALSPQVYGNASYNRIETSNALPVPLPPGVSRTNNDFLAFFSLTWQLDFWGQLRSATAAAYADYLGSIEARRAVVVTVVSSVANAYITLRSLDAQLAVSRQTYNSRLQSLKLAQSRFHLGETSELEVVQAAAELEITAISVLQLERDIPVQENLLSILIGMNPSSIERGSIIEAFQYPIRIPAGMPSELLIRRPDIAAAEDALIAADARVMEAIALLFPQINLTGQYGNESDELHKFLTSPALMWQYGVNAVQTIFDAGKTVYEIKEAEAVSDEALHSYYQTILNAFREVDDALIVYKMDKELVAEHRKNVEILTEYLRLATLRYNEGEVDYLNVLDAERTLFDAQIALVQAQADSFSAVVGLYSALGGGWVIEADNTAVGIITDDL